MEGPTPGASIPQGAHVQLFLHRAWQGQQRMLNRPPLIRPPTAQVYPIAVTTRPTLEQCAQRASENRINSGCSGGWGSRLEPQIYFSVPAAAPIPVCDRRPEEFCVCREGWQDGERQTRWLPWFRCPALEPSGNRQRNGQLPVTAQDRTGKRLLNASQARRPCRDKRGPVSALR